MSESAMLVSACFAAAFIGAVTGAGIVWRLLLPRANGGSKSDSVLQEMQQCLPALLQQTLKVESAFYAQRQSERDGALSLHLERWQAEQAWSAKRREEQIVSDLRIVSDRLDSLEKLERSNVSSERLTPPYRPDPTVPAPIVERPVAQSTVAMPSIVLPTGASTSLAHPKSARPPELLSTPLPRATPVYSTPEPTRELTDEEIDALPADLPAPATLRKRILPSPKKPNLRSL